MAQKEGTGVRTHFKAGDPLSPPSSRLFLTRLALPYFCFRVFLAHNFVDLRSTRAPLCAFAR
jgi:hypothetical protein